MYPVSRYARKGFILLIVLAAALSPKVSPQTNPAQPPRSNGLAFDAVSIKLHKGGASAGLNLARSGGHVRLTANLRILMILAYNLHSLSEATNTIIGLPNWGISETFDIQAEAPGNPTVEQKTLMLQSLLANRFKMVVHRETRQMPIYALVLANPGKLGSQLHEYTSDPNRDSACAGVQNESLSEGIGGQASHEDIAASHSPAELAAADLRASSCRRVVGSFLTPNDHNQVWAGGKNVSMDAIAAAVGSMVPVDRPVVNRTGLAGDFDFTVEWDSRNDFLAAGPGTTEQGEPVGPSLFEAMKDQVGLKFESTKGPVDVIVIDHVEEPKQN
ncbi:MAG TPA: TIGR03435 family protein [Candidatus Acidoferrales bacterium]|nr:TIGR03435 family protein [Candidatus Acidoferrales bacterium]